MHGRFALGHIIPPPASSDSFSFSSSIQVWVTPPVGWQQVSINSSSDDDASSDYSHECPHMNRVSQYVYQISVMFDVTN
jgi:hypothetical protein